MGNVDSTVAKQIAQAAIAFQHQVAGHEPRSVDVVLNGHTLLITLHGALSPAEIASAQSSEGAAKVQEFHRQLFASFADPLRHEIERITGVEVCAAIGEIARTTGVLAQVTATGTMVQVFLLADRVPTDSWSENRGGDPC